MRKPKVTEGWHHAGCNVCINSPTNFASPVSLGYICNSTAHFFWLAAVTCNQYCVPTWKRQIAVSATYPHANSWPFSQAQSAHYVLIPISSL